MIVMSQEYANVRRSYSRDSEDAFGESTEYLSLPREWSVNSCSRRGPRRVKAAASFLGVFGAYRRRSSREGFA